MRPKMIENGREASRLPLVPGVTEYAIFMLDPEGIVVTWNAGAERIKGYRADEIVGEHFSRFYTEEDRQAGVPKRGLERALREGKHEDIGWRVRKDGSRFVANVVIEPLRDGAGELIGFAKITRDVTERARMAHDFNNLVHAAATGVEALRQCLSAGDPCASDLLDIVQRNIGLASSMMRKLLAYPEMEPPAAGQAARSRM